MAIFWIFTSEIPKIHADLLRHSMILFAKFFLCQILAVLNSFDGGRAEISFEKRLFSKGTFNCHCLKIQYLLSVRYSIIMANSKDVRPSAQNETYWLITNFSRKIYFYTENF